MFKIIGKKIGMSHIYNDLGKFIPVSMIYIPKQYVLDTDQNDSLVKIKLCAFEKKNPNKSIISFFQKKNKPICKIIWEFRFHTEQPFLLEFIDITILKDIKILDVTGYTKGKGFAGVIKRWGFSMQDATHGNSLSHRAPGSIGQNQSPGRVIKGKKMAGHLGNKKVTKKNLIVVNIDIVNNIIFVKGSIPGSKNSNIFIIFNLDVK